jgi:KaiC/GvpD/RAD55 family RecA-like ATPase
MTAALHIVDDTASEPDWMTADARAAADALIEQHPEIGSPTAGMFVDWSTFWTQDRLDADWLDEGVLARGRSHAFYASHKTGKSLFLLERSARIAVSGRAVVVYLDYEMTENDLHERLEEMGYGPGTDLSRLRYALLPSLPPLDTPTGAAALVAVLDTISEERPGEHVVVIIDTTSRAIAGDENSADTIRAFYRWTGITLKQRGHTVARLDHAGKDATRGQRGSSAKGDDVDVVWRVTRTDSGVELVRDAARMSWVPERSAFRQHEDPLQFAPVADAWPAGTAAIAAELDALHVALDAGERPAARALRDAGHKHRVAAIRAALKYRRQHSEATL